MKIPYKSWVQKGFETNSSLGFFSKYILFFTHKLFSKLFCSLDRTEEWSISNFQIQHQVFNSGCSFFRNDWGCDKHFIFLIFKRINVLLLSAQKYTLKIEFLQWVPYI